MPHTHQKEETRAGKPEVSPSVAIDVEVFSWKVSIRVEDFQGPLGKKWHHHSTVIVSILITVAVCIKETTFKVQIKVVSATWNTNFALLRPSYIHPGEEEETKQNTRGTKWQEWVSKWKQYQWYSRKRDRVKGGEWTQPSVSNSFIPIFKAHLPCCIQNINACICVTAGKGDCLLHLNLSKMVKSRSYHTDSGVRKTLLSITKPRSSISSVGAVGAQLSVMW